MINDSGLLFWATLYIYLRKQHDNFVLFIFEVFIYFFIIVDKNYEAHITHSHGSARVF